MGVKGIRALSSRTQLRALASPARQEILDLLVRTGPASAAELGRLLRRPGDGLYYHLRALQRNGLVQVLREEGDRGRRSSRFRSVQRQPAIRHETGPDGNSPEVTAIVSSMLRLGCRDFRRAAAMPNVRTAGPKRDLWALRVTGWLTSKELEDVNRRMRGLRDVTGRPRARGRLYAITILLTPLDHRRRKAQRRPRRGSTAR